MAALDDLVSKAKELADSVGRATGELVDDSRVKLQEMKLNSELRDAYERLGSLAYDGIKTGAENQALVDLVVSEVDAIRQSLEELRTTRAPAARQQVCPQCGASCADDAAYCSRCGAPLDPLEEEEDEEDDPADPEGAAEEEPAPEEEV